MSHSILCRGDNKEFKFHGIKIINYPFENDYLADASNYFWNNATRRNIWGIINCRTLEIDSFFTEAQQYINQNGCFHDTRLYSLLNNLLETASEIVIWYSDFAEDIPIVTEKEEFFNIVKEGINEPSCEVYVRFQKKNE